MAVVGVRELVRNARAVIEEVERTGRPTIVTRRGRLAVALVPLDEREIEDYVLATAPSFVRGMREAERDLREGRTRSLVAFLDEIERQGDASEDRGDLVGQRRQRKAATARSSSRRSTTRATGKPASASTPRASSSRLVKGRKSTR